MIGHLKQLLFASSTCTSQYISKPQGKMYKLGPIQLCHSLHLIIFYLTFSVFSKLSLYISHKSCCISNSLHGFIALCILYMYLTIYQQTTGKNVQYNYVIICTQLFFYLTFSVFSKLSLYISHKSCCISNSGFIGVIKMENLPSPNVNLLSATISS